MSHSRRSRYCSLLVVGVQCLLVSMFTSISTVQAHQASKEIAAAATRWLESLAPEQQRLASFAFEDTERENWHYVPKARKGLSLQAMSEAQRTLAKGMLRSALSEQGQTLVDNVIALEQVLFELEHSAMRDPGLYYVSVFGSPAQEPWGWRVEGHHLSVNFALRGQRVAVTPAKQGARALAKEEDLGRALARSMTPAQRATAFLPGAAPAEIITAAAREVQSGQALGGIAVSELSAAQRAAFVDLMETYAHRLRGELAEQELAEIKQAGWEQQVRFAWAGGVEPGQGHYYRIHGPTFLIEYDNTQGGANHIHTVWRKYAGDFGRDLLKEHYDEAHQSESTAR